MLSNLLLLSNLATANELNETDESKVAAGVQLITGTNPNALPIGDFNDKFVGLLGDLHTIKHTQGFHLGANAGIVIEECEVKPVGIHVSCDENQTCEAHYSAEGYCRADDLFGLGLGMAFDQGQLAEFRAPIGVAGFGFTPFLHKHEDELEPGIEISAPFKFTDGFSAGFMTKISSDVVVLGITIWAGHAHPH